jgi:hypothetical protein
MSEPKPEDRSGETPDSHHAPASNRANIAAILVIAALVIGGWFLTQTMRKTSALQDCVMAGRSNCAPVAPTDTAK